MPLTSSLVSHTYLSCATAPMTLSTFVATNAAAMHTSDGTSGAAPSSPTAAANAVSTTEPTAPAAVPSRLTAPSVPGGTRRIVVIRYVVLPYALPISLAHVSESLVASAATKPSFSSALRSGKAAEPRAQTAAVAAEPHTFSGPRMPPRPSAIPIACFLAILTLVTRDPPRR
eukprot:3618977-Prymnesium_polylepis.1